MKTTYEQACKTVKTDKGLNINLSIAFHYFNEKGINATKKAMDEKVTDAVNKGLCNSGSIIAYGSLNTFPSEVLMKLFDKKNPKRADVDSMINCFKRSIERTQEFLDNL